MNKKIIGYTTGVFDLFHIGHLNLLKRAKKNCDYLIVGVSTDELVQEYKGKTPVIPYKERVEIVKGIKYVDEVVPQVNRNKYEAWETYKFDKMFVGDDWKGNKLFLDLEDKLRSKGSEIIYFPYTKGTSSTLITQILKKMNK